MIPVETFYKTYTPHLLEILDSYIEKERIRLSEIVREGDHHQMLHEKYNMEKLITAKMVKEASKNTVF